jgi:hypothetical protein
MSSAPSFTFKVTLLVPAAATTGVVLLPSQVTVSLVAGEVLLQAAWAGRIAENTHAASPPATSVVDKSSAPLRLDLWNIIQELRGSRRITGAQN